MKTRPLDFKLYFNAPATDLTMSVEATHDGSGVTYQFPGDSATTLTSGTAASKTHTEATSGYLAIAAASLDFSSTVTELICTGQLGIHVDQIPDSLTKFVTAADNCVMNGTYLPASLTDLQVESLRSTVDADRIIEALENGGASSGNLMIGEQLRDKTATLLESRSWSVNTESGEAVRISRSASPHSSTVDGKSIHHTDRDRTGDRRRVLAGRCWRGVTNDYCVGPADNALDSSVTMMAWVKVTDGAHTSTAGTIISKYQTTGDDRACMIRVDSNSTGGRFAMYVSNNGGYNSTNAMAHYTDAQINDGTWHHVAGVFDSGTMTLYIDGEAQDVTVHSTGSSVTSVYESTEDWHIGDRPTTTEVYDGDLGPIQVFKQALTAAQIAAYYNQAIGEPPVRHPYVPLIDIDWEFTDDTDHIINKGTFGHFHNVGGSIQVSSLYSHCNEIGYSPGIASFDFTSTNPYYLGYGGDYEFTGEFRADLFWRDDANGTDEFGFTAGDIDVDYQTAVYQHCRDLGLQVVVAQATAFQNQSSTGVTTATNDGDVFTILRDADNRVSFQKNGVEFHSISSVTGSYYFCYANQLGAISHPVVVSEGGTVLTTEELGMRAYGSDAAEGAFGIQAGTECCVPADPADPTKDILGNTLKYQGPVPRDLLITNKAVELNGTTEGITVPHDATFNFGDGSSDSPFSASAWVKVDAHGANKGAIIGKATDVTTGTNEWFFTFDDTGQLLLTLYDDTTGNSIRTTADEAFPTGEWHHVLGTYDGGGVDTGVKLYIDGVLVQGTQATAGSYTAMHATSTEINVGFALEDSIYDRWLDGQMADAKIFDVELTAAQAMQLYQNTLATAPIMHLPLAEESGEYCWDVSGNGHHGTGAPTSRDGSQTVVDYLIKSGCARVTHYNGTDESETKSGRLTRGTINQLSVSAWIYVSSSKTNTICSEYEFSTNDRSWSFRINGSEQLEIQQSDDGTASTNINTTMTISLNTWHHVAFVYDAVGDVVFYLDGATEYDTNPYGTWYDADADFTIGNALTSNFFDGMISHLVVEQTEWTLDEVAAIGAAGTEADINAIRPDASVFINGGYNAGFSSQGTPDLFSVPYGAGPPANVPAGTPSEGQSRALTIEANSPWSQAYDPDSFTLVPAQVSHRAAFPGSANRIDFGSQLIGATDDFDIEMDIYPIARTNTTENLLTQYTLGTTGRLIVFQWSNNSGNEGLRMFIGFASSVDISEADEGGRSASERMQPNEWTTARATRVGNVFSLYRDGVLIGTDTNSGSVQAKNTMLGTDHTGADDFEGYIRNVRINVAGTVTEYFTNNISHDGTATNVTSETSAAGMFTHRRLLMHADHTGTLYKTDMHAKVADMVARKKYGESFS